jgi:hypothetical protein
MTPWGQEPTHRRDELGDSELHGGGGDHYRIAIDPRGSIDEVPIGAGDLEPLQFAAFGDQPSSDMRELNADGQRRA